MINRAFLVLGPESSGTRLMTRLLITAGCYGDDGHKQRLDEHIPDNEPLIVWRRSVPHDGQYPDLAKMVKGLRAVGYVVTAVIMSRDWHAMAESQVNAPHTRSKKVAAANTRDAYRHIFAYLPYQVPYELVNYESLTRRPETAVKRLYERLGLDVPAGAWTYIYDGNAKYYEEAAIV